VAKTFPLSIVLGAVDKVSGPLAKVAGSLEAFGNKAKRVGAALTVGISAPIGAFLALTTRSLAEFDRAMSKVAATTNATEAELAALREQAERLGETPPFSGVQVAEAQRLLAREGLRANAVLAATPAVLDLAAGHALELATAVEITTRSMDEFGRADPARIIDELSSASSRGGATLENLAMGLEAVSPVARAMKLGLEDTLAVLVELDKRGVRGSRAGSVLASGLARATAQGAKFGSITELLERFGEGGDDAARAAKAFGRSAGPVLRGLLGEGVRSAQQLARELEGPGSAGDAARRAARATDGAGYSFARLAGAVEKLQHALERAGLLRWVGELVDGFADWIDQLAETDPWLLKIGLGVAAAAAVIGPLFIAVGQLAVAFNALTVALGIANPLLALFDALADANPVGVLIIALAGLVAGLVYVATHWEETLAFMKAAWVGFTEPVRLFLDWIERKLPAIARLVPDWLPGLLGANAAASFGAPIPAAQLGAAAGAPASAGAPGRVEVDFKNVQRGTSIKASPGRGGPVDVSVGYAMGS